MSLNEEDKEYFKLVIESSINSAMKPMTDKVVDSEMNIQELQQTVFGPNRDNGLNGDMKSVKRSIEGFNMKLACATGAATGISIVIGTIIKKLSGG
jgi:hypothetical protein